MGDLPVQRRFVIKGRLPTAPSSYSQSNEQELRRIIELALATPLGDPLGDGEDPSEGILTVMEAIDRLGGGSGAGVTLFVNGSLRSSTTAGIFYTNAASTGHPFTVHSGVAVALRKSSGAEAAQCIIPEWPVYANWEDLGPVASNFLTPLKYVFECVVMRHAATCEIGIKNKTGIITDAGTTPTGYVLYDDSGTWAVRRRLTAAGAVENLTALVSMSSTVARKLEIVYEEGVTSRLTFLMDDEVIYQTTGAANMPEQPSSSTVNYGPSVYGNILTSDNRLTIEEI